MGMTVSMYVYMYVHHECTWCLERPEEDILFLETGVMDGCESLCGCWNQTQAFCRNSKYS